MSIGHLLYVEEIEGFMCLAALPIPSLPKYLLSYFIIFFCT